MDATVVKIGALGNCEARTNSHLLVVFSLPQKTEWRVGDALEFAAFGLDRDVLVTNVTRDSRFTVHIAANNVHDLDLPLAHGSSRTPSEERIRQSL